MSGTGLEDTFGITSGLAGEVLRDWDKLEVAKEEEEEEDGVKNGSGVGEFLPLLWSSGSGIIICLK